MLTARNRLKVNKLFILGAGASHSASQGKGTQTKTKAPLDKDFCEKIINLNDVKPNWGKKSTSIIQTKWKDHKAITEYGLEQAIIRQFGHLEFIESINQFKKGSGIISEFDYLNHLSHLICFVLKKHEKQVASHIKIL